MTEDVRQLAENIDAFGNLITDRTNVLDLAAHYPYSPERWRLTVDGSRVFPEYSSVSQYNHATDRHELKPASGETVVLEAAERPRYVVQYELAATWAFTVNQSLSGNDKIKIGLYDGSDGWYIEHNGGHPDDQTGDAVLERAGSEVYRESNVDLHQPVTQFARLKLESAWYDVTRQIWERSYPTSDGRQRNNEITRKGAPGNQGPQTGNLPMHFEVQADGSTTGLILEAGSAAQVNLGKTTQQSRDKNPEPLAGEGISASATWDPLRAFRADPDRDITNLQLSSLKTLSYGKDARVSVSVGVFPDSKVTFSGSDSWGTPTPLLPKSTVLETRQDVSEIANGSGTLKSTTPSPGGFNIGTSTLTPTNTKQFQKGASTDAEKEKAIVPRSDIAVALAKTPQTASVTYATDWREDW